MGGCKNDIIKQLERDILRLQPFNNVSINATTKIGFGPFLHTAFPAGCLHEFLSASPEDVAASNGFVLGLFSRIIQPGAICAWISASRSLFPPALKLFGIEPDQIIFIDLKKEKDVLCAVEEALKCGRLSTVLGEVKEISFTESRRLPISSRTKQGHRFLFCVINHVYINTLASVSRWRIRIAPQCTAR
jgi:protein ImuA